MYSRMTKCAARVGCLAGVLFLLGAMFFCWPQVGFARFYIDINSPSAKKFNVAIPDFVNLGGASAGSEFSAPLDQILSDDLDLSGYFNPMDKAAFLEGGLGGGSLEAPQFKNWSVIGAELLIKGGYRLEGGNLEVEIRMYDVYLGTQILGKRIVGKPASHRLLIHRLANEIIKLLTGHDGIFSTKLAFVGTASGNKEIYTCDIDGFDVRQITSDKSIAMLPRWSPDGETILFNSYKDGKGPKLYMKTWPDGPVRMVSNRAGLNIGAAWVPGGKDLALTLSMGGSPDIYLIDLNGKIIKQLTNHWDIDVSPSFSPDGQKMAFVSNRSGSPQIYVKDLGSGTEERITFDGNYNTSPTWSALNRIAYVSMQDGMFDIFTIDPDGRGARRMTANQGNNEEPCWSPDGRYLVFSSNRTGPYHLYIMNANGQTQRMITSQSGQQSAPSWAP